MKFSAPELKVDTQGYARCFESHKPLPIGEYLIYGGSCSIPMVANADIYVGFDGSMKLTSKQYPWNEGEEILYRIPDMGVPPDPEDFKRFIDWLAVQLTALKLVHIGCIGGHGRTGTVLAALVKHMTGEVDAITYVRNNYCVKAVESATQVKFLNKYFGIKEVKGCKEYTGSHGSQDWYKAKGYPTASNPMANKKVEPSKAPPTGMFTGFATQSPMCIWGSEVMFDKTENVI